MKPRTKGKRISVVSGAALLAVLTITTWFFWGHIRFWWLFESMGPNEQGYLEYRHRQTGMVMVRLQGGAFLMGTPDGEGGRDDDEDRHEVTVSAFLIGKYEVTQAAWKSIMGENPSRFRGSKLPVENVSWIECSDFCQKTGLVLPTEAQWEFACRDKGADRSPGVDDLDRECWHKRNSGNQTHSVGQKRPNDLGVHDMHGNVWEWCLDGYDKEFYSTPQAHGTDPVCPSTSEGHVRRGGSWWSEVEECRSGERHWGHAAFRDANLGFRVAFCPLP